MPFKSDKQRKWMHANEPEMAKKWEKEEKNEGNIGITTKKDKTIELTHRKSGKEIVVVNTPSVLKKYKKLGYLISMPEGKLIEAYKTATRNELAMYISQLSNTINGTKDKKMLQYLKKTKKEVEKELKSRKTNEGKLIEGVFGKFDTGINFRGNGLTVYDRNQSKGGDFKSIAFIVDGKVKLYDKDVKKEPKLMIALQNIANSQ